MTEKKWTPGPWEAVVAGVDDVQHNPGIDGANGSPVVWISFRPDEGIRETADAHLIAAAPEMYDALEAILNHYIDLAESGDAGFWDPEKEDPVINARVALAKARGETE